jgi:5'-nucleotidase
MRILVTNDDGIHAPGLDVAEKIARALSDDVWVIAPESEQSGASHSLTLSMPLRLRPISERCYAVSGTPTDCVMMGCLQVMKDKQPDLILSGVNWGSNLADDVTYSGTIAGAMEGCALGIPSVALTRRRGRRSTGRRHWCMDRICCATCSRPVGRMEP